MPTMKKIGRHKTHVYYDDMDGWMKVKYHNTILVKFNEHEIILNRGRKRLQRDGRINVTAKNRMNQASSEFALGYIVFTKGFEWFVGLQGGSVVEYQKNLKILR